MAPDVCRSMVRTAESLKRTAYHESGHALVAFHTAGAHPIHKATIVPRGHALGMVQQVALPPSGRPMCLWFSSLRQAEPQLSGCISCGRRGLRLAVSAGTCCLSTELPQLSELVDLEALAAALDGRP